MATRPRTRKPLTKELVLARAIALADADGIDALTMRKLGQSLGVEAMSLYNHVANKGELVTAMVDSVVEQFELPDDGAWDDAIRRCAISVHDALTRHPWACPLLMSPGYIRPARLEYMDALLGRLREAGFSADATYHAYHVLDAHIFGFSLWQANHSYNAVSLKDMAAELDRMVPVEEYPHLHEHGEQHLTDGPLHEVSAFQLGLDLILGGLEQTRGTG